MTMYSRDEAARILAIATKAPNIVEADSALLAQLAGTIIELYDRLPAPPQIIRTRDELAALDPDTMLVSTVETLSAFAAEEPQKMAARGRWIGIGWIPAVVIATGDQVRAAQQALKEAADAVD